MIAGLDSAPAYFGVTPCNLAELCISVKKHSERCQSCLTLADGRAQPGLESALPVLAAPRGSGNWRQRSQAGRLGTQAITLRPTTLGSCLRCLLQDISDPQL